MIKLSGTGIVLVNIFFNCQLVLGSYFFLIGSFRRFSLFCNSCNKNGDLKTKG